MTRAAAPPAGPAPPPGTVERWAWDYVLSTDLDHKLAPPPVPSTWEPAGAPPRRIAWPGRPASLRIATRAAKSPGPEALRDPARRAQLVHTFLHHELQAAELMAWALLAFPAGAAGRGAEASAPGEGSAWAGAPASPPWTAPRALRAGLVRIALDEVRHAALYADYLAGLGRRYGDYPVRDWFWERVPGAPSVAHFAAVMGMGFEGGNLDHTLRFAARFRAVGDATGAALQELVCAEEIPHVRFGVRWFRRLSGDAHAAGQPAVVDFNAWARHLPAPLSPLVMRGHPQNRRDRLRAGFPEPFLDALEAWSEAPRGS